MCSVDYPLLARGDVSLDFFHADDGSVDEVVSGGFDLLFSRVVFDE